MEGENQRRTWEYLQGITRKDGSYGKILSDAFAAVLDGGTRVRRDDMAISQSESAKQDLGELKEVPDRVLEQKFHKIIQEIQEVFAEQMNIAFREYMRDSHSGTELSEDKAEAGGMGQMQELELSEDMMAFAFAMGE